MTLETQARMLRLLEEGTYERVGGSETLSIQARIVAATNRNLEEMVNAGTFREDSITASMPFQCLCRRFASGRRISRTSPSFQTRMAAHLDKQIRPLTVEVIEVLQAYNWSGNVRELEHTIQRAVIVCQGSRIEVEDIGLINSSAPVFTDSEIVTLDELERRHILKVLKATNWRIKGVHGAAALLGLHPATLYGKMRKQGIKRPGKDHI